jgi:hypothetical protein
LDDFRRLPNERLTVNILLKAEENIEAATKHTNSDDFRRLLNEKLTLNIPLKAEENIEAATKFKNGDFWDVTPCASCKNRRFGGAKRLHHHGDKNR